MTQRLRDPDAIERRLLELAYTTDAKVTAPALAYLAPCSLADAARVLEHLAATDRLTMEVEDDGTIVYHLPGRTRLALPLPAPPPTLTRGIVAVLPARPVSPLGAAALSLFLPGAGHLYAGRILAAVLWFLVVSAGYTLILPGLVMHLFAIASAARAARRTNRAQRFLGPPAFA